MKSSVTQLVELAPALAAVIGADSVHTADAQLDAYSADTYWPAIAARANGTPLGRPDVVAVPRTEDDVAAALRVAAAYNVPVVAWGGGSGTQGGEAHGETSATGSQRSPPSASASENPRGAFLEALSGALRPDIPFEAVHAHVDDDAFADVVAARYLSLVSETADV